MTSRILGAKEMDFQKSVENGLTEPWWQPPETSRSQEMEGVKATLKNKGLRTPKINEFIKENSDLSNASGKVIRKMVTAATDLIFKRKVAKERIDGSLELVRKYVPKVFFQAVKRATKSTQNSKIAIAFAEH